MRPAQPSEPQVLRPPGPGGGRAAQCRFPGQGNCSDRATLPRGTCPILRRFARLVLIAALVLAIAAVGLWSCLALWYRLPAPPPWRPPPPRDCSRCWPWPPSAAFSPACGPVSWPPLRSRSSPFPGRRHRLSRRAMATGRPTSRTRSPAASTATRLTLAGVRNFDWTSETAFDAALGNGQLRSRRSDHPGPVHVLSAYRRWPTCCRASALPTGASSSGRSRCGADGGDSRSQTCSRADPLVIIAADERDIVALRTNFRVKTSSSPARHPAAAARKLLIQYVDDANALAEPAAVLQLARSNCTTTVVKMARAAGDRCRPIGA